MRTHCGRYADALRSVCGRYAIKIKTKTKTKIKTQTPHSQDNHSQYVVYAHARGASSVDFGDLVAYNTHSDLENSNEHEKRENERHD